MAAWRVMDAETRDDRQCVSDRTIDWPGFFNARDLGGLSTCDGRVTRWRALIRCADPRYITEAGWRAARDAGVRTIIDLRNDDEIPPVAVPADVTRAHVPIEGVEDVEFWRYFKEFNATPLYYRPFLDRMPDRCAAAVTAVARAQPGGIIFHCGAGRDRTGLLALLLLRLVGVAPEIVAEDYASSAQGLAAMCAATGRTDEAPAIERILAAKGTTVREAVLSTCDGFDARAYLLGAGVGRGDLAAVRDRLLA